MSPSITSLLKPSYVAAAVVLLGSLFVSQSTVSAATITWGGATDISAVSDVSTTGNLVDSATLNSVDQTVNGVTFNGRLTGQPNFTFANGSNISVTYATGTFQTQSLTGGSPPYVVPYPDLIDNSGYAAGGSGTITLGGLVANQQYQVQIWSTYWGDENQHVHNTQFGGASGPLLWDWRTPQYVIGTFTADAGSQTIGIDPGVTGFSFSPGALQLRAIPEPTTLTLGALGLTLLCASRYRRRSAR